MVNLCKSPPAHAFLVGVGLALALGGCAGGEGTGAGGDLGPGPCSSDVDCDAGLFCVAGLCSAETPCRELSCEAGERCNASSGTARCEAIEATPQPDGGIEDRSDCQCEPDERRECGDFVKVGECSPGNQLCDGCFWLPCRGAQGPSEEICDGRDNDCDGTVDEIETLGTLSCGVGACAREIPACQDGAPAECAPGTPEDETCNDGIDNDCDGATDEAECRCQDGTVRSCYTGPTATRGVGPCVEGEQTCVDGEWQPCLGEGAPSAEQCDGADNDCDGNIDEDLGFVDCGIGACRRVLPRCTNGVSALCVPGTPRAEICWNGIDEDCDGEADQVCECEAGEERQCEGADLGICDPGRQRCVAGRWGSCEGRVPPRPERCSGLDEDCDGLIDEDAGDVEGALRNACGGCAPLAATPLAPCDADGCSQWRCDAGGDALSCDADPARAGGACTDDGNACTVDRCEGGSCVHVPLANDCGARVCGASPSGCFTCGECSGGDLCGADGQCGDPCTGVECGPCARCMGGACTPIPDGTPCEDDENACTFDMCLAGTCTHDPAPDGLSCDDGRYCTTGDRCEAGQCAPTGQRDCSFLDDVCSVGQCDDLSAVCVSAPRPGNPPCADDGSPCTLDICRGGSCAHEPFADGGLCDDDDRCTQVDRCRAGRCEGQLPIQCPAGSSCTAAGVCNPTTGLCEPTTLPDGAPCDDLNPNTHGDHCVDGICTGEPCVCNRVDACCDGCAPRNLGSACNDEDACTQGDVCQPDGSCAGVLPDACLPGPGRCTACETDCDGTCRVVPAPGYCIIDGACEVDGALPAGGSNCRSCRPEISRFDWTFTASAQCGLLRDIPGLGPGQPGGDRWIGEDASGHLYLSVASFDETMLCGSDDGGLSWEAPDCVTLAVDDYFNFGPSLDVEDDGTVHVGWGVNDFASTGAWYARWRSDTGLTPPVRIDDGGAFQVDTVSVAAAPSGLRWAGWSAVRGGTVGVSTDRAAVAGSFGTDEVAADEMLWPSMCADDDRGWLTGRLSIFADGGFRRDAWFGTHGGSFWQGRIVASEVHGVPQLACEGGGAWMMWTRHRSQTAGLQDGLFLARCDTSGCQSPPDRLFSRTATASVGIDDSGVAVAFVVPGTCGCDCDDIGRIRLVREGSGGYEAAVLDLGPPRQRFVNLARRSHGEPLMLLRNSAGQLQLLKLRGW